MKRTRLSSSNSISSSRPMQRKTSTAQVKPKENKRKKSHKKGSMVMNKDVLQKNLVLKQIVIPCVLALCVTIGYLFYFNIHNNNVESQVQYIKQYYKNGVINDWQGKLNCKGVEDIKWFKNNKMVEIHFGNIAMSWEYDKFIQKSNLDLIRDIGFEVYYSKSAKDIELFWCGNKVERWVK